MNIVVFDTETIGKVSQDLLNVGYRIVDLNPATGEFKTLLERDFLVGSLYHNTVYMLNDDFVGATKYGMYTALINEKRIIKHSIGKILEIMAKDLKKHHVIFSYAYNSDFDVDKFKKTCDSLGCENPLDSTTTLDIWSYAINYICNTPEYIEWARDNQIFTESGRYLQTSVEGVTKFLTNNLDFVEDHTALSDTHWELLILSECVKRGCDITKPMSKAKRFIESGQIFRMEINGEIVEYKKTITKNGITYVK